MIPTSGSWQEGTYKKTFGAKNLGYQVHILRLPGSGKLYS